jgi:hypothetical protein
MRRGDLCQSVHQEQGFSYLMLLGWIALSGVVLMAASTAWRHQAQREREIEMVFRAEQIQAAITAYAAVPVSPGQSPWPRSLEVLLTDERSGQVVRHLRRVWPDPLTGGHWGLVREGDGIRGVHSLSRLTPLRAPKGVSQFDEWRFLAGAPTGGPTPASLNVSDVMQRQQTVTPAP